jgi:CcmD family protein
MENAGFLFAAFAIVWAVTFIYVILLLNRQKKVRREIESLRKTIESES